MTLEQRRMSTAYAAADRAQTDKTWLRAVQGLGPEIQRSGLLQALAFIHRKPTRSIAPGLCTTLRTHLVDLGHLDAQPAEPSFLLEVQKLPRTDYMRVTRELIAFSVWLKRAAEILDQGED